MGLSKINTTIRTAVVAGVLAVAASMASATTFTYDLRDNPDGGETSNGYTYGLRLDDYKFDDGTLFMLSFTRNSLSDGATLVYNSSTGDASIAGEMLRSAPDGDDNLTDELWTVVYNMTGVVNTGPGVFVETAGTGTGSITNQDTGEQILLSNKARGNGDRFIFSGSGRGDGSTTNNTAVGEGWVGGSSTQDFLFLADLQGGGTGGVGGQVPLPAAGWMLIAGLGGLGAMRRRQLKRS